MISLALKLLIAHVIGDFLLQPDKWVKDKEEKKQRSAYLYLHLGIHALALIVLLKFNWEYWPAIIAIITSHYIIDLFKLHLKGKVNSRILFTLDQAAHLGVISLIVLIYEPYRIDIESIYSLNSLLLIFALLCTSFVSAIIMQVLMSKWKLDEDEDNDSLKNAGKYIGILERMFVFAFIALGQWQAIGFLIAAKSVFRFSDLSRAKDRKLTEYILIGTLLSFGLAIFIGLSYQYTIMTFVN